MGSYASCVQSHVLYLNLQLTLFEQNPDGVPAPSSSIFTPKSLWWVASPRVLLLTR